MRKQSSGFVSPLILVGVLILAGLSLAYVISTSLVGKPSSQTAQVGNSVAQVSGRNQLAAVASMANIVVDPSSPGTVKSNAKTLATSAFTPPAGSTLYVLVALNSNAASGQQNSLSGLTDSLGTHLNYVRQAEYGSENSDDALVYLYTAPVTASQPMTVSATQNTSQSGTSYAMLKVLVVTGASASQPVGAKGGGRGIFGALSGTYTATTDNSLGWLLYADWSAKDVPTVGSNQSLLDSYTVSGQDTYAVSRQNSPAASGSSVTMNTTAPTSGAQTSYLYFEMVPAVVMLPAPAISSVSTSAITTSGATINWTTDQQSDSQVEYGLTTAYGSNTALDASLVTSHSASLSGLQANTVYHYRVDSKNSQGTQAKSADSTFTTSPAVVNNPPSSNPPVNNPPAVTGQTLLSSRTPALTANSDGSGVNYELGTSFKSTAPGQILAIRFFKSSRETGTHTGRIWNSSGNLLGTVTFTGETASGWQQQTLPSPVSISANTEYTVSVNTGNSYYVSTDDGFRSPITSGTLSSSGPGHFGLVGAYPTKTFETSDYFRDIVFNQTGAVVNPPPTTTFYSLSVSKSGTGTGTVTGGSINCGTTCTQSNITAGTSIALTAAPAANTTVSWTGCTSSSGNTCNVSINSNVTVTAMFTTTVVSTDSVPTVPTNLKATTASASEVDLSWTASSDTDSTPVAGYDVYSCQGTSCTNYALIANVTAPIATTFKNTGLVANTSYRYVVAAYDTVSPVGSHISAQSSPVSATTLTSGGGGGGTNPTTFTITPSVSGTGGTISPSGATVVNSGSNQTFTFTANSGYQISSVTVDGVTTQTTTATSYTFTGVVATHTISVAFAQTVVTPPPTVTPPSAPTNLVATPSSTSINLAWTASVAGTNAVSGYNIYVNGATTKTSTATTTSYSSTGLTANTAYSYAVTAVDSAGNESGKTIVSATTLAAADTTAPVVTFTIPSTSTSLTVNFTTFTATDNVGVTGYMVTETATAPLASASGWTTTPSVGYIFTTAGSHILYAWAKDAAGNISTAKSATVTITLPVVTYTITATAGSNGTITPSGATTVNSGANQTFNFAANSGYQISSVTVDGVTTQTTTATSYTFTGVAAAHTISVTFAQTVVTPPPSGTYSFDDEFNGTALDTTAWAPLNRPGDESNSEQQCYYPSNSTVSGGYLNIVTKPDTTCPPSTTGYKLNYSSDMVQWRTFNFLYGTLDVRAKMPGQNTWPAIWLLGNDCQTSNVTSADNIGTCNWDAPGSEEVDMAEFLGGTSKTGVNEQIHSTVLGNPGCSATVTDASLNYHVYTLVWTPTSIVWKIDGVTTCTQNVSISHPLFLMMNTALTSTGSVSSQQNMSVDYVRVTPYSSGTADTQTPSAPTNLMATPASSTQINLTWTASTDNVGVTGYNIYVNGATTKTATVTTTSYSSTGLAANTAYSYAVTAVDSAGNESGKTIVSATTLAAADTTAPVVTFTVPSTSSSLTVNFTTFTATDAVGVIGYMVNETATPPLATATGWTTTPSLGYVFTTAGAKTLYAWAKDAAGNVSTSKSASVTVSSGPVGGAACTGTCYYVSPSGTGTKSGADWSNTMAWSSINFTRGVTYYLADGTYSRKALNTPVSGTQNISIVKAVGQAGQTGHGSDTGWNYSTMGAGQANIDGFDLNSSYWVIDGQKGSGFSVMPPDDNGADYGIYFTNKGAVITYSTNGDGLHLTNITVKHVYAAADTNSPSSAGDGYFFGIYNQGYSNTSVSNLDIAYSYFYGWGQVLCLDGKQTWNNVTWEYNIHEQMYSSQVYDKHGNPINMRWAPVNNLVVRYSLFYGTYGDGGISETVSANNSAISNSFIYGNVFDQNWSGDPIIGSNGHTTPGITNTVVYNNTFLNSALGKPANQPGGGLYGTTYGGTGNIFENNLAYSANASVGVTSDYNEYVFTTNSPSETHGKVVSADISPFVNWSAKNYALNASTPAGVNLGAPYNVDALGHTRTTWSRGAFEF